MAKIEVGGEKLAVTMHTVEELGAWCRCVRVPLASARSVRAVEDPGTERRGIRAPGTGLPAFVALGILRGRSGKDFAAVYHHRPGVVVALEGAEFSRLVVSSDDAVGVSALPAAAVGGAPAGGALR